jgi:hypothetical protein
MEKYLEGGPKSFLFRELPKNILIGTASDRYAGWIDQTYSQPKAR